MCEVIKVATAFKFATIYFTINYNSDRKKNNYSGTPLQRRPCYNEQHLKAQQNFSKIYGNKPRYNEPLL